MKNRRRHTQRIATRFKKIIRVPRRMLWAFVMEGVETKNMLKTFGRKGREHLHIRTSKEGPTEEEMQKAIEQLKDIPRFLPFFVFVTVPVPGVTEGYVLVAITLEKWMGQRFSLLPSNFRDVFEKKEKDKDKEDDEQSGQ